MDSMHVKATELLPWYVNGTLSAQECGDLERHLGECLVCRGALREEQRMQGLVQDQDDIPLTAEHHIGSLLSRIDAGRSRGRRAASASQFAFGAAIACSIIVGSFFFFTLPELVDPNEAEFSTLTDSSSVEMSRIDIVFSEGVESADILVIIEEFDGRVVSGPSDLGRYTVAISDGAGLSMQDVIDTLTDDPRVSFVGRNFITSPSMEGQ